jgi:DNA-binding transcriptional ArsR family regulator
MRDLADGRSGAIGTLATAIGAYEQMALAPHWPVIAAAVEADRARRAMAVLDGGCEGLLASLRPAMRWNSPVLEADFPFDQELHLDGRGLLLVPSYFCWEVPITLVDPGRPPVLVYPIDHPGGMLGAAAAGAGALAALIGRTRASVLASIGAGCTTTELSRRTGVSAASASQHATVLRAAGLVDTRRDRNAVLHSLTPSGTALLAQAG